MDDETTNRPRKFKFKPKRLLIGARDGLKALGARAKAKGNDVANGARNAANNFAEKTKIIGGNVANKVIEGGRNAASGARKLKKGAIKKGIKGVKNLRKIARAGGETAVVYGNLIKDKVKKEAPRIRKNRRKNAKKVRKAFRKLFMITRDIKSKNGERNDLESKNEDESEGRLERFRIRLLKVVKKNEEDQA